MLSPFIFGASHALADPEKKSTPPVSGRLHYSINAYSFNSLLKSGEMTFDDMMTFAAELGLDAVDLTGYYFPSYPEAPENAELFHLKRNALQLGLDIPWTGIRNDFVNPDPEARKAHRALINAWLAVSSKLGATIMRVFAGTHSYEGFTKEEVKAWMVEDYKICAKYGEALGVIVGLQHHNDFLFRSEEVIDLLNRVNSEWFGLILDIGSLHAEDPYEEINKLAPYANYWFIKEYVYPGGQKTPVDMDKIAAIIKKHGYRGYVSFESLSEGDPKQITAAMYHAFKNAYEKT